MTDAELLQRFSPYLQYDSLESFRADSAAELPEGYFDDGTTWSYTNSLKRKDGSVLAAANPRPGQTKLDLTFLGATRYRNRVSVRRTDYVDAAGRRYVADARRMHADPRVADRIYGHVAREANGTRWAQYWFFYYYNDKNFLGIGLHEGDWEMIQLRIDAIARPWRRSRSTRRARPSAGPSSSGDRPPTGWSRWCTSATARMRPSPRRVSTGPSSPSRPTTRMARARASAPRWR